MELWDIYDIDRQKTGKLCRRVDGKPLPTGTTIWSYTSACLTRRVSCSSNADSWTKPATPGCGTSPQPAAPLPEKPAHRQLPGSCLKRWGFCHDFTNERPAFTVDFPDGFDDVYLIQTPDIALSDLRLQTQEVLDANWATLPQILQLLKEERFVPYYPQLVQLWFAMKGRFGSTTHE